MKMLSIRKMVGAFVVGLMVWAAASEAEARSIRQRAQRQGHRIEHGVKNGELTRRETRGLVHEQRGIHQDVRQARQDGDVTRRERFGIQMEQNRASRHIFRQKHDHQDRDPRNQTTSEDAAQ